MPVAVEPAQAGYAHFPGKIERDRLGRWCHLSEADVGFAGRRAGDATRMDFAVQLATVRAIGTFLADPTAVPPAGSGGASQAAPAERRPSGGPPGCPRESAELDRLRRAPFSPTIRGLVQDDPWAGPSP